MKRIIDVHGHLSKFWLPMPWRNRDIVAYLDRFSIEKYVASSLLAITENLIEGNRETWEFVKEYPGRVYGYVVVNPHYVEASLKEIERYSRAGGFVGVKVHDGYYMNIGPFYSPNWRRILGLVSDLGWTVLCHDSLLSLSEIAPDYPEVNFISAHAANSTLAVRYAQGETQPNIFLDICGTPRNYGIIERIVELLGSADNILFGTDLPLLSPASAIGKVENAEISQEEKEKILYKNALRIFNF